MITSLRLKNFRRHAETELHFDDASQIVLISGGNGVGKSTLLEAIGFAFYGESRHGKRQLDNLIRRGAELEGMEVECSFVVDGTDYRVIRRRDNRLGTAILFGNDQALTQGTDAVTDEISRIFGMDSAGFRLAAVAQQKQLDGLASMRSGERAAMIARLVRVDVIGRAKDKARAAYRIEKEVLSSMGEADDLEALRYSVSEATRNVAELEELLRGPSAALVGLTEKRAALHGVAAAWRDAGLELSRAEGRLQSAREELARAEKTLSLIVIPESEVVLHSSVDIRARQTMLAAQTAQAESSARLVAQHQMLVREVEELTAKIEQLELSVPETKDAAAVLQRLESVRREIETVRTARNTSGEGLAVAKSNLGDIERKLTDTENLGALCEHCGQVVTEEHRTQLHRALSGELEQARQHVSALETSRVVLDGELTGLLADEAALALELNEASTLAIASATHAELLVSNSRRREMSLEQLDRLGEIETVDIASLDHERSDLAAQLTVALASEEASVRREAALEKHSGATTAVTDATTRCARAELDVEQARPSEELIDDHLRLVEVDEELATVTGRVHDIKTQLAVGREKVQSATQRLFGGEERRDERTRREDAAVVAANTADVLDVLSSTMTTRIRPILEGAVSELLSTLSDGRFSAVKIDEDYAITVLDDGQYRALGDCSGGEVDLVALAVRLALASVVGERHGRAPGFLILDEVFGSQDAQRRLAITGAIRNLRHIYPQVFLISHVGGLEDEADVVIELERTFNEDEVAGVEMSLC
jgi:exonuclease SbcC